MGDETGKWDEGLRAAFERAKREIAEALTRLEEAIMNARPPARPAPAPAPAPAPRPVVGVVTVPERDARLDWGTQDERTEVFIEILSTVKQPWSVDDAMYVTRLGRRTVERHITHGQDMERIERVSKGLYQILPVSPPKA